MSDITQVELEALDIMDDNHLSLGLSEVEVSTYTCETTNPSLSFVTADIKHKSLADSYDEKLLSNSKGRNEVNSTLITKQSHSCELSRKVLHYRIKENLSQSESTSIDVCGKSKTELGLPKVLKITMYTKDSDAECAKKQQFMNVHGTVYILDHIDTPDKKNKAKECFKVKIDQTSDFLHGLNEIETAHFKKHYEKVQGETPTNHYQENISEFEQTTCTQNEIETAHFKKHYEKVQDETPTNHYQENISEFEQTTCTHNVHLEHCSVVHKDEIYKSCCKECQRLTALVHDHNYYHVPEGDMKTDSRIKENMHLIRLKYMFKRHRNKLIEQKRILKEKSKINKMKAMKENKKLKKEVCKLKKIKAMEEKRKLKKEVSLEPAMKENKKLKKEVCKLKKIKAMEEKRKLKKEVSLEPVPCPVCKEMILPKYMAKHKRNRDLHSKEPLLCAFCGKLFLSKSKLYNHKRYYHDASPKTCNICHNTFKSIVMLWRHRKRTHPEQYKRTTPEEYKKNKSKRIYLCPICGKTFLDGTYLNRHIRIHSDERPFKCSYCDADFKAKHYLLKHTRLQHSEKVYLCMEPGCDKKYQNNESLKRHLKMHQKHKNATFPIPTFLDENDKRYLCTEPGCDRKYRRKGCLHKHLKLHQKRKTATIPMPTIRTFSDEENSIIRDVFKEEIAGNRRFDIEKMQRFIKKYPWVLKDVQTQNDKRLQKIRAKLYMERFYKKHSAKNHGKTNTHLPSESSNSSHGETEAHDPSEPSDSNSGETWEHSPPELLVNICDETL